MDATNLLFYLPCDRDLTDLCGNTWSTEGSVSVDDRSLNFTGEGYVYTDPPTLGANDFTFSWREFIPSSIDTMFADTICIDGATGNAPHALGVHFPSSAYPYLYLGKGTGGSSWVLDKKRMGNKIRDEWVHRAIVRSGDVIYVFENGALYASFSFSYSIDVSTSLLSIGGLKRATRRFTGLIKEFQFYDVALWTEDFTPPTDDDYFALAIALNGSAELEFSADVRRKVKNSDMTWRYENEGVDWKLLVDEETGNYYGVTLENLPESQSRTGTAFYQYSHEKCFDLPSTSEVWIKFDVYFDGSNRWRAYNGGANGATGITAQTTTELSFFSNDSHVQQIASGTVATNQLQTVLLHMVSGSSDGVIEAWIDEDFLYRYEGDVNHGEVFADIYLQSDGNGTFFSNVIISNEELTFADGFQVISFDLERNVEKTVEISFDTQRRVKNVVDIEILADVEIKDVLPVELAADVIRRVTLPLELSADVEIFDVIPVEVIADVNRAILTELALYATDNSEFFSGGSSTTIVIPSLEVMPPAENNSDGLQSVEISIAEQQLTDQIRVIGVIPLDILYPVRGQYLDYICDMRVERVQKQGVLYTADCCSNIDELLFTQIAYKLPATTTWQKVVTHYPPASQHITKIANALGLTPVMQFDNFLSTVLMDDLGGVTYNDLIRDVFSWSSRVPTMMINVYIRNGKLFVIQRGHEANVIDISDADKTLPIYTHELVRTTWGSAPWSKTKTHEQTTLQYIPPDHTSGDDDEEPVHEVRTDFYGIDSQGYTIYRYNDKGLLVQTNTYVYKYSTKQNTYTTVNHGYDDDGTNISTRSFTQSYGDEGESASKSVNEKGYVILPNGEKFLSWEYSAQYQNNEGIDITDSDLVDSKYTVHSPSRVGQKHVIQINGDGDISGEVVGQDTGDDRVTPFATSKAQSLAQAFSGSGDNYEETTVGGFSLYDSSFPIHDEATLIKVTNVLKWLNRKTRETVTLSIYNYPHVIDFNERIVLGGHEYFLVSNTAHTTSKIFNEQNLTLVRWF